MKQLLIVIFSLAFCLQSFTQTWDTANELYSNKKYNEAVEAYKNLESKYASSVDYWYNRGNAAYKNKQLAQAIFAYEKALNIDPNFTDASFNLNLAKNQVVDKISPSPSYAFNEKVEMFLAKFDGTYLVLLSIISLALAVLLLLYYRYKNNKNIYRSLGYTAILIYALTLALSLFRNAYVNSTPQAIVAPERVSIMAEPSKDATSLYILHEGTKVILHSEKESNNWQEIELSDGRVGWCEKSNLLYI